MSSLMPRVDRYKCGCQVAHYKSYEYRGGDKPYGYVICHKEYKCVIHGGSMKADWVAHYGKKIGNIKKSEYKIRALRKKMQELQDQIDKEQSIIHYYENHD
jgi:protein-arginine kinase activator protein McsA